MSDRAAQIQSGPGLSGQTTDPAIRPYEVICLSLEPWDEVWRRNQLFATELLRLRPDLQLLFVEQPIDISWSLAHRRRPGFRPLRRIGDSGRLWAAAPIKWLPRRIRPGVDAALGRQVRAFVSRLSFRDPVLWINDSSYASWAGMTGWPSVYDITDDWLAVGGPDDPDQARERLNEATLLRTAAEVVVCSPNLVETRGRDRAVHLIPNGVDVDHFRRPHPRPSDLPPGPIVLYTGTLAEGRLDVELCAATCRSIAGRATFVMVGPNSLTSGSAQKLRESGAVLLGSRPYEQLPAFLQHADLLAVPHLVTPFTESLDPIKAREMLAVGRPTLSTPVAGFRDLAPAVTVATVDRFAEEVLRILTAGPLPAGPGPLSCRLPSWSDRAADFLRVLDAAASRRQPRP